MTEYILIFVTAASAEEADRLGKALVEKRLVACANHVHPIQSVFWWKETIEDEQEALLILKSRASLFAPICKMVTDLHSYDVPEIIAIPILAGSEDYLRWIKDETCEHPA